MGSGSGEGLDFEEHESKRGSEERECLERPQANKDCKDSESCNRCVRCAGCRKCEECGDCISCENCKKCEECRECEDCKGCELCEKCKNCVDCQNCVGCVNSSGHKNCKGCSEHDNQRNEQASDAEHKDAEAPSDKILFDSLVTNEKEYLEKVLRSQVFGIHEVSEGACLQFFNWLLEQFERIRIVTPPPTLIYNLEFLSKMAHTRNLFEQSGNESKREIYLKRIVDGAEEDYEAEDLDVLSLAYASREYIEQNIVFFDSRTIKELDRIYDSQEDQARKQFFMERLPYIMKNRNVFRLIRELIKKMDESSGEMDIAKSISIWDEAVVDGQMQKDKRDEILMDLIEQDFDYVPLKFYDQAPSQSSSLS